MNGRPLKLAEPQKYLGPRSLFVCVLLIELIIILSIDMYVPALPGMQKSFDVSVSYLNLTMFIYFAVSAVGMVISGPASDRFGRKPLLVGSCVLFAISSAGCALAPSVEVLVIFRGGQALSYGTVVTIMAALIKDSYADEDLKLAMTLLQSLIIVGPAAAPFLGTFILTILGWRDIFWFLAIGGLACTALSLFISETHPREKRTEGNLVETFGGMIRTTKELLTDRRFFSLSAFLGVAGVPYFAFIAVVSYVLLDFFLMDYLGYSLIYFTACVVTIIAPYLYVALSKRFSVNRILVLCIGLTLATFLSMALVGSINPWLFLIAFVPYALAEGIVRPMAFVELLDQPDDRVGAASAFANFSYGIMTAVATVLATLEWPTFIFGLIVITGACGAVMIALYAVGLRGRS